MKYLNYFLKGMASVLDLSGEFLRNEVSDFYERQDLSHKEKDEIMLARDWEKVGKDLRKVLS